MKTQILFKDEFKEWLISSKICKLASADSYVSYLSGVNKQFDIDGYSMCERIEKYHNEGNPNKINNLIINLVGELFREDICEITGRPKNTINNWRSALLQYTEFFYFFTVDVESLNWTEEECTNNVEEEELIYVINENIKPTQELKILRRRIKKYKYSVKDLIKNFRFRIVTQDRFYGEIFFPISYIKRLMDDNNETKYFNNWIENQLNDITIYGLNETYKFRDISELTIHVSKELNEVYITVNNEQKLIYTPSFYEDKLIPFGCANLKSIAIDHVVSMKSILIDNIMFLPQLKLITQHLKAIAGERATAKEYKSAGSVLLKSSQNKDIDVQLLKLELDLIKSNTKFQLMDKIENIKKGAK